MGALNGVHLSNTYFFAKEMGWTGLLIEGAPMNFAALRGNRPESICLNALVCDKAREMHMIEKGPVGGVYEFMGPAFRKRWHPDVKVDDLPTVPCVPMKDILERFSVRHVDFFSLDVEGAEAAVVSTIDFTKFSASVIVMEWGPDETYKKALATFQNAGYIKHEKEFSPRNVVLLHPEFVRDFQALS